MENYRKPLFIAFVCAAALAMVGAAMGWFEIGNTLVKQLAESELVKKQNLALGLSAASIAALVGAAKSNKYRGMFASTVLGIYQLIMIINQKPDDIIAKQIDLSVGLGYWMSIVGTLGMILLSGIIGLKGFDFITKKQDHKD